MEGSIMVVPNWPTRMWYWYLLLLQMAMHTPVLFQMEIDRLSQNSRIKVYCNLNLQQLHLSAWKLNAGAA